MKHLYSVSSRNYRDEEYAQCVDNLIFSSKKKAEKYILEKRQILEKQHMIRNLVNKDVIDFEDSSDDLDTQKRIKYYKERLEYHTSHLPNILSLTELSNTFYVVELTFKK